MTGTQFIRPDGEKKLLAGTKKKGSCIPVGGIPHRRYIPGAQLKNPANKNRAIYQQWVRSGWLTTTPGDCIDYDRIRDDVLRDAETFSIKLVGCSTYQLKYEEFAFETSEEQQRLEEFEGV